jgi:hypothetical protein
MKKLILFTLLIACIACSNNQKKLIISNISKEFDVSDKPDTLGDGRLMFTVREKEWWKGDFVGQPYKIEPRIKAIIDKTLHATPTKTKEHQFTVFGHYLYNYYEWDTPDLTVTVQNNFEKSYKTDETELRSRIWIYEK